MLTDSVVRLCLAPVEVLRDAKRMHFLWQPSTTQQEAIDKCIDTCLPQVPSSSALPQLPYFSRVPAARQRIFPPEP